MRCSQYLYTDYLNTTYLYNTTMTFSIQFTEQLIEHCNTALTNGWEIRIAVDLVTSDSTLAESLVERYVTVGSEIRYMNRLYEPVYCPDIVTDNDGWSRFNSVLGDSPLEESLRWYACDEEIWVDDQEFKPRVLSITAHRENGEVDINVSIFDGIYHKISNPALAFCRSIADWQSFCEFERKSNDICAFPDPPQLTSFQDHCLAAGVEDTHLLWTCMALLKQQVFDCDHQSRWIPFYRRCIGFRV